MHFVNFSVITISQGKQEIFDLSQITGVLTRRQNINDKIIQGDVLFLRQTDSLDCELAFYHLHQWLLGTYK